MSYSTPNYSTPNNLSYRGKRPHNEDTYRTPKFNREPNLTQDSGIRQYLDSISEERGTYPYKYRYLPSTGQIMMEYATFKTLKEAADTIRQQQKAEEEKKKLEEEQKRQEAFLQKIAQFIQPKDDPRPSPTLTTPPAETFIHRNENIVTVDMLTKQKEDIIATLTQAIKENQNKFNPPPHLTQSSYQPPHSYQPSTNRTLDDKAGQELDKKAWIKLITQKLAKLKAKKDWTPAIEGIRKRFKHFVHIDFEDLNKKEAIEKLGKSFSKFGSPSEDLLYESDYESN